VYINTATQVDGGLHSGDGVRGSLCFFRVGGHLVVPTFARLHSLNYIEQLCFIKVLSPPTLLLDFFHLLKKKLLLGRSAKKLRSAAMCGLAGVWVTSQLPAYLQGDQLIGQGNYFLTKNIEENTNYKFFFHTFLQKLIFTLL